MQTEFIAEVSSNHHQDLERCLRFVDEAARIGCGAVKFQLFKVRELFSPEVIQQRPEVLEREQWELPVEFLPALAERCRQKGVKFSCTPFYLDAVRELEPHVDFYKIASYELLWDDLLEACARTVKPVVLSTGMADMEEIRHAVSVLRKAGCKDLTLLHCVSGYPTPPDEANLAAIETIREATGCPVGWSDHSVDPSVVTRAIHRWGATRVEFHLDLDKEGSEYATGHCWLPSQIEPVIQATRHTDNVDGSGEKVPAPSEAAERDWRADPTDGLRPLRKIRGHLEVERS